ncbi:bifunctional glutamate N-acetyltransferase/amino-acid acetyltransferase ArgJ [Marinobacteraceae bacterium S3BR75-40.1]
MAVGLGPLPEFAPIEGVRLGTACAGIKKPGRRDLVVVEIAEDAAVAAVFTQNQFCAAPVLVAREHLAATQPRYLLINTGNANAGNGQAGLDDANACCRALAETVGCSPEAVLPFSTGVIGEPLPVDRLTGGLGQAVANLAEDGWALAAEGIMTTDTQPKGATRKLEIEGHPVHLSGISKGAGMIRPNMATMLGYIATDAAIAQPHLQALLRKAVDRSFNRITVDSDTSTNDACVAIATGRSGAPTLEPGTEAYQAFEAAFIGLALELAQALVRDAEGATKFVRIDVTEAASAEEALDVAFTVAHSPLVKTALFASDPNWGRILAAVGRASLPNLAIDQVRIDLGDVRIVSAGGRDPQYTEERGQAVMDCSEIVIGIHLGRGQARESVWTSDFSHDYVTINAEYRT